MKKNILQSKNLILFSVIIVSSFTSGYAQLNKLCPVSSTVYDAKKIKGMNLLLNTKDFTPYLIPGGKTKNTTTVQLVNAAEPFPPLWFQMGNPQTDTGNFSETHFFLDIHIQKNGGNITYFSNKTNKEKEHSLVVIDTALLLPIDTLIDFKMITTDNIIEHINPHDYQIDKAGNKLLANQVQKKIDARCLSGLAKDSARIALVNEILILNPNDSIIFRWDPFDHLSPCEMIWAYRNSSLQYGDIINWSHINSLTFANDGNILYSFRHIGLGKINRITGEVMWKLGGKDTLNSIHLPDSAGYHLQHDFLQREDGLYSVFSNGDINHQHLEALVYKIDEKNKKAELVNRYKPQPDVWSLALGNYDCKGDTCVICFGMHSVNTNPKDKQTIAHILIDNKPVAVLSTPAMNYAYQVKQTKWTAKKYRPKVVMKKKGILQSDSSAELHDYTWYKIDSTTATPVGTGKSYIPTVSGSYVVEAQKGTGLYKSFLVSDIFFFRKKK